MSVSTRHILKDLIIHSTVPSTNDVLWTRLATGKTTPAACLSETQTAGRGRRGDHWHSPETGNLYLSMCWPFPATNEKNGISIAMGVALINALESFNISDLGLKWPNDLLYEKQKLGGIIVESRYGKTQNTVIGIGLNLWLPPATQYLIKQATTSLRQLCTNVPCRNRLAGTIIQTMIETLTIFQQQGLAPFIDKWSSHDVLLNQKISIQNDTMFYEAIGRGIDNEGALRYQHNNEIKTLSSSHHSIRLSP